MNCPSCAAPIADGERFCESCGHRLVAPAEWLSAKAVPGPCPHCGSAEFGPEGFCGTCGQRRGAGQDHAELDLGGLGGATDRGHHKARNEDAIAIAQLAGTSVVVVCDGISSSTRPDTAATAAVDAAMGAVLEALGQGDSPTEATQLGTRSAAAAVSTLGEPGTNPPSCTYVSAIVTPDEVTIGWVGDSRAYWLDGTDSACLTVDDSLAMQLAAKAAAEGTGPDHPELPAADADPRALALVRWLGADSEETEPKVVVFTPNGPGTVLVCSDGLHRYLPEPERLAEAAAAVSGTPAATAAALTQLAMDAGGLDNIAVAIVPFPPRSDREDRNDR
jgi:serine/threonine protein phosphatase PrpC